MKLSVGERQAKIRVLPFTGRGGLSLKRRLVEIFTHKKAAGRGTGGSENPDELGGSQFGEAFVLRWMASCEALAPRETLCPTELTS